MARIQQSIDVRLPVHVVYNQLTQFEDYPRFMQDVQAVEQQDDTHLHWRAMQADRPIEWDAEIVEQEPDRCIAWHTTSGPLNAGRMDVEQIGPDASRVTLTIDADPAQMPGASGDESALAQRVEQDLVRFKQMVEAQGKETGAWRGQVQEGEVANRNSDAQAPGSGTAAATAAAAAPQVDQSTQSDYALSQGDDAVEDGRFSVAEEVSMDMQTDDARRVGQLPQDASSGANPAGAMAAALAPEGGAAATPAIDGALTPDTMHNDALKEGVKRAVPRGDEEGGI